MRNPDPILLIRWEVFRALMRKRRIELGLTQNEVGAAMGRSNDYVCVLENDPDSIPNLTTTWLWVDALGGKLSIEWGEDDDESEQSETAAGEMVSVHQDNGQPTAE